MSVARETKQWTVGTEEFDALPLYRRAELHARIQAFADRTGAIVKRVRGDEGVSFVVTVYGRKS